MSPLLVTSSLSRRPTARRVPTLPWISRLIILTACIASTTAVLLPPEVHPPEITPPVLRSVGDNLVANVATSTLSTDESELRRRQRQNDNDEDDDRSAAPSSLASTDATGTTGVPSAASTLVLSITPPTPSSTEAPAPLPSPFDTVMASTFTSNEETQCPAFLNALLADPEFKKCYPISMLLQGSYSFFNAARTLVSIVRVLDAGCEADVNSCKTFLGNAAQALIQRENCGPDYERSHPVVRQAYLGLTTYEMLYAATCLQNPETSMYCYASAVTNQTNASNVYFYLLPLNMSLPGSATPTCNWCLGETMAILQAASADRAQPIANSYESAARQVNTVCGPEFVNETLPEPSENLAGLHLPPWTFAVTAVALAIPFLLL
ncbi:hypothetical protein SODALDRAFT_282703 [Sodiomyces alkalinus F11]|uniref:DUF7729 domain-containing protein n=1 Tax=Sodiomyces alkalinus (strain CBS 110278 / VKM F-3762 / F11) TaxID=1314773 RepID=A0A3N2PNC2_SODAK|nr:hypothetical protein SODALDRAFT_282703 [Sodiomyces alkalinus F11]ROT36002.1 hypothetical protein SODALDRAFT_282703 [Sodiomyces alkalinus F11]